MYQKLETLTIAKKLIRKNSTHSTIIPLPSEKWKFLWQEVFLMIVVFCMDIGCMLFIVWNK